MKKTTFIIALLYICATCLVAQDASQYIPENAWLVASMNAASCNGKLNTEEVWKLDLFKEMDAKAKERLGDDYEAVSKLYKSPSEVGLNVFPQMHLYIERVDSLFSGGILLNMGDLAKFETFISSVNGGKLAIADGQGFRYVMPSESQPMAVVWSKSVLAILMVAGGEERIYEGLNYEEESYYEQAEARRLALVENQVALLKSKFANVAGGMKSINGNANFAKYKAATYDVGLWMSMEGISAAIAESAGRNMGMSAGLPPQFNMQAMMQSMTQTGHYQLLTTFNEGNIQAVQRTYVKPELFPSYAKIYQKSIDPKFFSYLNANNMLGMYSMSIDVKQAFTVALDSYMPMLEQMPQGQMAKSALDVLGIAIDEDALTGLMKGDMLLAVSDVREMETVYYEYEYDEDFNMNKVERMRKEPVPIMTAMMGIGNQENFMKIINALVNVGVMKKTGDIYEITVPQQQLPGLKLAIKDGIFFASNDDALWNGFAKGLPKNLLMNPALQAEIMKANQFAFMDMPNILAKIASLTPNMSPRQQDILGVLKAHLGQMKAVGVKANAQEGYFQYDFQMNMTDAKTNSAQQLFKLIDALNKPMTERN